MSDPDAVVEAFAYGEEVGGVPPRSLGYQLLAPAGPTPWTNEVEALARRLQAAPYPERWPPAEVCCSVLLGDDRRVVAIARYGLADHTPSRRRGGLELVGVVAPGALGLPTARALWRWLRHRRGAEGDLRALGGRFGLPEAVAAAPPASSEVRPPGALPPSTSRDGARLFRAASADDPDRHLGLLGPSGPSNWQWLPHVGPDFPLAAYATLGPLIAWEPLVFPEPEQCSRDASHEGRSPE